MFEWLKKLGAATYSDEERAAVEEHIEKYFGIPEWTMKDRARKIFGGGRMRVDLLCIPPSHQFNIHTVVTCGMGAYRMKMPEGAEPGNDRAELVVSMPAYWNPTEEESNKYWPAYRLHQLGHFPEAVKKPLGLGSCLDFGEPLNKEVRLSGVVLTAPFGGKDAHICELPDGGRVKFYQMIPIFPEEVVFHSKYGAEKLVGRLARVCGVEINPNRVNVGIGDPEVLPSVLDVGRDHSSKVEEYKLDTQEIAGYQHMAIYLRWMLERGFEGSLLEKHKAVCEAVRKGEYKGDLREFVRDALDGVLRADMFSDKGAKFSEWYYGWYFAEEYDDEHCYPKDIDDYALEYFGETKYNCAAFKDEAYMFVPWTEKYYQSMKEKIDEKFAQFEKMHA